MGNSSVQQEGSGLHKYSVIINSSDPFSAQFCVHNVGPRSPAASSEMKSLL